MLCYEDRGLIHTNSLQDLIKHQLPSMCSIKCQSEHSCLIMAKLEIGWVDIHLSLQLVQEIIQIGYQRPRSNFEHIGMTWHVTCHSTILTLSTNFLI